MFSWLKIWWTNRKKLAYKKRQLELRQDTIAELKRRGVDVSKYV